MCTLTSQYVLARYDVRWHQTDQLPLLWKWPVVLFSIWPAGSARLLDPIAGVDPYNEGRPAKKKRVESVFTRLQERQCLSLNFNTSVIQPTSDKCSEALEKATFGCSYFQDGSFGCRHNSSSCMGALNIALHYHCYAYRWGVGTMPLPILAMALHFWHHSGHMSCDIIHLIMH